jgi:hypothetical protein
MPDARGPVIHRAPPTPNPPAGSWPVKGHTPGQNAGAEEWQKL